MAYALARAEEAGLPRPRCRAFLTTAVICPVLTAHPTEVRRKSTIDRELELAQILTERDRVRLTPEEEAGQRGSAASGILTLWQTSILRRTKLNVVDESRTACPTSTHVSA